MQGSCRKLLVELVLSDLSSIQGNGIAPLLANCVGSCSMLYPAVVRFTVKKSTVDKALTLPFPTGLVLRQEKAPIFLQFFNTCG